MSTNINFDGDNFHKKIEFQILTQLEEAVHQIKMPGQDSQLKQVAEAIRRENERIEAENRRKDKEKASLLKKIQNAKE